MQLILTGGGDSKYFLEIDKHFISLLGENPTLLYIPLAQKKKLWKGGLERITKTFSSIEFDKISMCDDLSKLSWKKLSGFSAIYIDGGNTFRLMEEIRNTHTYELFFKFLHHGGVINGDSAGAIVLGSHLESAHFGHHGDENKYDVISYQGLNFLGSWAIHCHYTKKEDSEIMNFSKEYGFPVMALHEKTALSLEAKKISVIGLKELILFKGDNKFEIAPGENFFI